MRVFSVLSVPALLATVLACAPPNPENEAPFIDVVSPVGRFESSIEDIRFRVFADQSTDVEFVFKDRSGVDGDFTVTMGIDPTRTGTAADLVDPLVFTAVPIDEPFVVNFPGGFPEGDSHLLVVANDDLGPVVDGVDQGERVAQYLFTAEALVQPVISPESPLTDDSLQGTIPEFRTDRRYRYRWVLDGVDTAFVGDGLNAPLPASETSRDEEWSYCIDAWTIRDVLVDPDDPSSNPEELPLDEWPDALLSVCDVVTIGNTTPVAPGVDLVPTRPTAAQSISCTASATDADGDPLTYTYVWSNGTRTVDGAVLSSAETLPGETWTCDATASDDASTSPPATDPGVMIRAAALGPADLVDGGTFTPNGAPRLAVVEITSEPGILVNDLGECRVYRGVNLNNVDYAFTGDATMGLSLASGDVDGDGFLDAAIAEDGSVYTVLGGSLPGQASGALSAGAETTIQAPALADPGFGAAVAFGELRSAAGLELVVTWAPPVPPNLVHVFDGDDLTATTLEPDDAAAVISGGTSLFGTALGTGGDFTGDGVSDLVLGDPGAGAGDTAVLVFSGGAGLNGPRTESDAVHRLSMQTAGDEAGAAVVFADLDGDGAAELIVGAPGFAGGAGAIAVYSSLPQGAAADFTATADLVLQGNPGDRLGQYLAVVSEAGGDGIAVGAPGAGSGNGAVHLFPGARLLDGSATLGSADVTTIAGPPGGALGPVAAGDFSGDGVPDLAMATDAGLSQLYVLRSEL